jgi:hypothetical protein
MNRRKLLLLILAALVCAALLVRALLLSSPKTPIALVHVVDATGKPVEGAIILPEGLRTKVGPYSSGWYKWSKEFSKVPNNAVATDRDGVARIPYPTYVFERIETGVIIPSVNHPDYVPDRPELVVNTAPPAGAPLRAWIDYYWSKIRRKSSIAITDTVVLKKGAILKISLRPDSKASIGPLFAQISEANTADTSFWIRPEPGVLMTRRLAASDQMIRAFQFSADGAAWFSDTLNIKAVSGQTTNIVVDLKPGVSVHGQLDNTVPRPVRNGRVVAHIWPAGSRPKDSPPEWHAWTTNREDGSFEFTNLPPGDLEIIALCQGFVSTNRPVAPQFRHPQKHLLGTNDLSITVGMEPTARLEVLVTDDKGNPLKDAIVMTWPNVHYGDWGAVVLMSDLYNTSDFFLNPAKIRASWHEPVVDLSATTESSGLAVLSNLPGDVRELTVKHAQFDIPAMTGWGGGKHRQRAVTLTLGITNHITVKLEPHDHSLIAHY